MSRIQVHIDSAGLRRFYVDHFLTRLDLVHHAELEEMINACAEGGCYYEDNGTVLGGGTRRGCRKFNNAAAAPHHDLTQLLLVKHPKACPHPGKVVGIGKSVVGCMALAGRLKNAVKRKCKTGAGPRCDCPRGYHVMRGVLKQTHPTMRLNQILSPLLEEFGFWLFVCTKIQRSRGGNPCRTIQCAASPEPSECADSSEGTPSTPPSPFPSSASASASLSPPSSSFGCNLKTEEEAVETQDPSPALQLNWEQAYCLPASDSEQAPRSAGWALMPIDGEEYGLDHIPPGPYDPNCDLINFFEV